MSWLIWADVQPTLSASALWLPASLINVAKLDKKEVSGQEFIMEELRTIRSEVRRMGFENVQNREMDLPNFPHANHSSSDIDICLSNWSEDRIAVALQRAIEHPELDGARIVEVKTRHKHLLADAGTSANVAEISRMLRGIRSRINRSLPCPPGEMQ